MVKGIATAIGTLLIVILILYLAYVFTKYLGRGINIKSRSSCMKVTDQIMLGRERSAAIVQIGTRYFLVGLTASQVTLLSELDKDEIESLQDSDEQPPSQSDFKDILLKIGNRKKKDE